MIAQRWFQPDFKPLTTEAPACARHCTGEVRCTPSRRKRDEANHRFAPVIEAARAQADAVVRLVNERRFDLLVAGFTGYSQLYEHIIGGTTDRLVRLAPCFVLAVR